MESKVSKDRIFLPAFIYGRLNATEGYSLLQKSEGTIPARFEIEAERIAIDWWGARPQDIPISYPVLGHFPMLSEKGSYIILKAVQLAEYTQPARLIIIIPDEIYRRFGYDPYLIEKCGFFDYANQFIVLPNGNKACPQASGLINSCHFPIHDPDDSMRDTVVGLVSSLFKRDSVILEAGFPDARLLAAVEISFRAVPMEIRRDYSYCSFSFSHAEMNGDRQPLLAVKYNRLVRDGNCLHVPRITSPEAVEIISKLSSLQTMADNWEDKADRHMKSRETPVEMPEQSIIYNPDSCERNETELTRFSRLESMVRSLEDRIHRISGNYSGADEISLFRANIQDVISSFEKDIQNNTSRIEEAENRLKEAIRTNANADEIRKGPEKPEGSRWSSSGNLVGLAGVVLSTIALLIVLFSGPSENPSSISTIETPTSENSTANQQEQAISRKIGNEAREIRKSIPGLVSEELAKQLDELKNLLNAENGKENGGSDMMTSEVQAIRFRLNGISETFYDIRRENEIQRSDIESLTMDVGELRESINRIMDSIRNLSAISNSRDKNNAELENCRLFDLGEDVFLCTYAIDDKIQLKLFGSNGDLSSEKGDTDKFLKKEDKGNDYWIIKIDDKDGFKDIRAEMGYILKYKGKERKITIRECDPEKSQNMRLIIQNVA